MPAWVSIKNIAHTPCCATKQTRARISSQLSAVILQFYTAITSSTHAHTHTGIVSKSTPAHAVLPRPPLTPTPMDYTALRVLGCLRTCRIPNSNASHNCKTMSACDVMTGTLSRSKIGRDSPNPLSRQGTQPLPQVQVGWRWTCG